MDLIISSNNIVTENGIISGKILIDQEKIVGIVDKEIQIEAKNYIDALDKTVIPGLIDTHVHIRFPAFPDWEDVYTGTSAAAAGGITTIFEMPESSPGVRSLEILKHRISLAEKDAVVDVAFYAGGGHGANKEYVK